MIVRLGRLRRSAAWPGMRFASTSAKYIPQEPAVGDKIFMAMSGGVDSAVAAALLSRKHGASALHPLYIASFDPSILTPLDQIDRRTPFNRPANSKYRRRQVSQASKAGKCIDREFTQVQAVCKHLGLREPMFLRLEKEYWIEVFEPMIRMYAKGLTPNPDVDCNRALKFGKLMGTLQKRAAQEKDAGNWWLATGHYARIATPENGARPHLLRSADLNKDQTFFLATIPSESLERLLFPLGDEYLTKPQVKEIAHSLHLPGWDSDESKQEESMGLCFVEPGRSFVSLLEEFIEDCPGRVVAGPPPPSEQLVIRRGTVLGEHRGQWSLTIGERSRIVFPQGNPAYQGKWYVSRKYPHSNDIEIVKGRNHPSLFSEGLILSEAHWLGEDCEGEASAPGAVMQYRHRQQPFPVGHVARGTDEENKDAFLVHFSTPQHGVSPGQAAVFWNGDRCLGGGTITAVRYPNEAR